MSLKTLIALPLLAVTLTGCGPYGTIKALPKDVPAGIERCFTEVVGRPHKGDLTQRDVFDVVAALKSSEKRKSACGLRLINWYRSLVR